MMKLVIGNKTYSSWSMRPWILMKHFELPMEEILIKLDLPETTQEILKFSPSAKVPALIDNGLVIWESLAIMEYLNEKFPNKQMYPKDEAQRAIARSVSAEMHAGFAILREHLHFHAKREFSNYDLGPALKDIQRIKNIWEENLKKSGGPFLFGDFSIADAMFAPVICRFKTYGVPTEGVVKKYFETMLNLPSVKSWYQGAMAEDFIAADHE
jgi:glutathione S-transferase